jgi:hypothetical protein
MTSQLIPACGRLSSITALIAPSIIGDWQPLLAETQAASIVSVGVAALSGRQQCCCCRLFPEDVCFFISGFHWPQQRWWQQHVASCSVPFV